MLLFQRSQILVQYLETPIQHSKDAVMLAGRDHFESAFYQIPFNSNDKVQVSTPQGPSDQPQWYHTFLFRSCSPAQNLGIYIFHQPRINKENVSFSYILYLRCILHTIIVATYTRKLAKMQSSHPIPKG